MMAEEMTSIQVSVKTRDRLLVLGIKGETYEDVVRRLLDKLGKKAVKK